MTGRRLEPQITPGQLTDATGIPLMVNAFDDNKADTTTMVPTIQAFMDAHQLPDVTVVADAGTVSLAPSRSPGDVFAMQWPRSSWIGRHA